MSAAFSFFGSSMGSSSSFPFLLLLLSLPETSTLSALLALAVVVLVAVFFSPGGISWALSNARRGSSPIPGPPGIVFALSGDAAHRDLSGLARSLKATSLMAFSVGFTRFVISSKPSTAREILNSSAFADRPVKESAYELLFHRAMGFAPCGEYWRSLRRISASYLFSPRRVAALGEHRRSIGEQMVSEIRGVLEKDGVVEIRRLLHFGSLNNVMVSVFGKRFDFGRGEGLELEEMIKEGYELLGVFNWSDHVPLLGWLDMQGVRRRCRRLARRVNVFVEGIIEEHRLRRHLRQTMSMMSKTDGSVRDSNVEDRSGDFVDVLLGLQEQEKISDPDIVAVLWEMIFRGTDTVAILLEWIMARMILHPDIQSKAQAEIDAVLGFPGPGIADYDVVYLPYLQSIVKETLRLHPPGPLLSWARLAVHDIHVGDQLVPAGTTAMVNMWAIAHDESIWADAEEFRPERFMEEDVSILGSDLRLAPFGAGRRVCPGKAMGLATVHLWLAQLLQHYKWVPSEGGVDLSERLKMSLEMEKPLVCRAVPRC